MIFKTNDTIAAISTPPGFGGIGVVRLSGPKSESIARKIFQPSSPLAPEQTGGPAQTDAHLFSARRVYHGHVVVPGQGGVLDEVLLVFMPAPNSYTREDVIEIQAHAGAVVLRTILGLVLDQGARLAEAGEFTRRAYLNGRIDLSQAEAVIDVIQAKTEASLSIASRQLKGTVGEMVHQVSERIQDVHAIMEAGIEFPEDVDAGDESTALCRSILQEVASALDDVLDGYRKGHLIREGLRLTILGKVNVGKSSLLNRFLRRERAIVTEIPGTTRDHIEETVDILGLPVILIDTAGWRDTQDPVEKIGIERTRDLALEADLILLMVDAEDGITPDDLEIYERIKTKDKILVVNKIDLLGESDRIDVPEGFDFFDIIYTSVKFERGLDALKHKIYLHGTEGWVGNDDAVVPNLRQKKLFEAARHAIETARRGIDENISPELTVMDLIAARETLDEITGASVKADVLDAVFSRFCIGK